MYLYNKKLYLSMVWESNIREIWPKNHFSNLKSSVSLLKFSLDEVSDISQIVQSHFLRYVKTLIPWKKFMPIFQKDF